jgi:hypothetical protein
VDEREIEAMAYTGDDSHDGVQHTLFTPRESFFSDKSPPGEARGRASLLGNSGGDEGHGGGGEAGHGPSRASDTDERLRRSSGGSGRGLRARRSSGGSLIGHARGSWGRYSAGGVASGSIVMG